ncbi:XRE family transcriptional regulator [Lachnospiraceae bacterium MD329]|nr:XRE family transcriptional regulator [Lachnospiraceae bacterium MD329]
MFDENKFRAAVIANGKTLKDVAHALDISIVTLYRKMSGESDFYRNEIEKCRTLLNGDNLNDIFFNDKVTQTEQKAV